MRPIPKPLLAEILADPYYEFCCYPNCGRQAELEHALTESGRQLNAKWAIIPCCPSHNRSSKMNKEFNRYVAYSRATEEDIRLAFPKTYKVHLAAKNYLASKYGYPPPLAYSTAVIWRKLKMEYR